MPLDFESVLIWSIAGLLWGIMLWRGLCNGCYGEPGLVCMHVFLGGSGILDKAVSCLRPWREVITGPTSIGLTGRLGGNFEVSGATVPPRLQRAIPPHPASVPVDLFPLSAPYQIPSPFTARSASCKLIYMPVWLA